MNYPCIVCDKEIKQINESLGNEPEYMGCFGDGIVERISAGYGSLLDGNMYVIAICDECIDAKCKSGKAEYVGDYMYPDEGNSDYVGLRK